MSLNGTTTTDQRNKWQILLLMEQWTAAKHNKHWHPLDATSSCSSLSTWIATSGSGWIRTQQPPSAPEVLLSVASSGSRSLQTGMYTRSSHEPLRGPYLLPPHCRKSLDCSWWENILLVF